MKSRIKYILLGIIGVVIIGGVITLLVLGKDEPLVDDEDLWPSVIEVSKENNLIYQFTVWLHPEIKELIWPDPKNRPQEHKEIYWPEDKRDLIFEIRQGKKWDTELVAELLENNEELLFEFDKIMNNPELILQVPTYRNPEEVWVLTPEFSFPSFSKTASLSLIKALSLFRKNQEKQAFEQALRVIRFGHIIQNPPNRMMEYLIGTAIKDMGLRALQKMISQTTLPPESLAQYIPRLDEFKNNEEGLRQGLKFEYASAINTKRKVMDRFISKDKNPDLDKSYFKDFTGSKEKAMTRFGYFYKPNKTERIIAEWFRHQIANIGKPYKEVEEWEIPSSAQIPSSKIKRLFTENLLGRKYLQLSLVSFSGALIKVYEQDFKVSATQLLLAIKAYREENNSLPQKLEDLVPEYITEVPLDPYDGEQIRYSLGKKIIYSVSKDLKDSGGQKGEYWEEEGDLVVEIDF